jgi:hypothetical protein
VQESDHRFLRITIVVIVVVIACAGLFSLWGRNAERVLSGGEKIRVTETWEERRRETDFATVKPMPAISPRGEIECRVTFETVTETCVTLPTRQGKVPISSSIKQQ